MKIKSLRKKIRKLEVRLQEGPKKLARWKQKLAAMEIAAARKAKRKAASQAAGAAQRSAGALTPVQKNNGRSMAKRLVRAVDSPKNKPARKVKKKRNLSPERRAQLAAAMKARWAAKRAVADGNPRKTATDEAPASRDVSPSI